MTSPAGARSRKAPSRLKHVNVIDLVSDDETDSDEEYDALYDALLGWNCRLRRARVAVCGMYAHCE